MKTILFVESDDAIRKEVADMMGMAHYHILTAKNGKEGFTSTKKYLPDIVVSAMVMPIIDGLGLLYMLRHDPVTEAIPVIFLASRTDRSDFRNAMDSGADDFITKPFNADELFKAIENRLRRVEAIRKKFTANIKNLNATESVTVSEMGATYEEKGFYQKEALKPINYTQNSLYFICNNRVKALKTYEDGKQLIMALYNDEIFLGYIALLAESTYKKMVNIIDHEAIEAYFQKMS